MTLLQHANLLADSAIAAKAVFAVGAIPGRIQNRVFARWK